MKSSKKDKVVSQIFKVVKVGTHFKLANTTGKIVGTNGISTGTRKKAYEAGKALRKVVGKGGKISYRLTEMSEFENLVAPLKSNAEVNVEKLDSHKEITDFIHTESVKLKPEGLVISDLKWKYLIRSAVRAKNIMMTGPAGCGKTMAAKALTKGLKRPDFYFNLGATQDARATLIGNTHFDSKKGTFFSDSAFVKAIKTPNAVILLDELSRAHPDAWNILMTVLDLGQRYLRLDEAEGSPVVNVAEGVTFIATANIGGEYTSTRVLDRANLLKYMYPTVNEDDLKAVAEIAHHTREVSKGGDGKLSTGISTRASVETAGLIYDGFSLFEAAEISMFPFFSNDGGVDSERTYVKQLVQKYVKDDKADEALFTEPTADDSEKIVW